MLWSDFTLTHINYFNNSTNNINNNCLLLNEIKNERKQIKDFIKKNNINIKINLIKDENLKQLDKKINSYSQVNWVDTKNLINDLINLDKTFEFTWLTSDKYINKMYIKTTDDVIKKIIKRIKFLIYIGEYLKYKTNNISKAFDIYIILSNLKKNFPTKNKKMKVPNVNGGYTDIYNNYIFIWRYEEFEKVLLHEIIHFVDMDLRDQDVNTKLNINGPSSFFEALTDFFAIFYNLIFLSIVSKISIRNLLQLELTFIENQAMALNEHYNLGNWQNKISKKINQTTPALSYYILKYLLFKYFMENKLDISNYNELINKIIKIGLITKPYVKLNSSRMSLLQLG
jgi:hypothetical protein